MRNPPSDGASVPHRVGVFGFGLLGVVAIAVWLGATPSRNALPTSWGATLETKRQAMDVVRRTLRGDPHPADGAPALAGTRARRVYVSLHRGGGRYQAEGLGANVADSLVIAARALPAGIVPGALEDPTTWVKIDVVTGEAPLASPPTEEDLDLVFETGLDGIRTTLPSIPGPAGFVLPSDPITEGWFSPRKYRSGKRRQAGRTAWSTRGDEGYHAVRVAQIKLQQALRRRPAMDRVVYERFRTEAFIARLNDTRDPVPLYRGMPAKFLDHSPSPAEVRASAMEAGAWLVSQLDDDGKFKYIYLPNRDQAAGGDSYSTIRHTACAWMLVKIGRRFDVPEWVEAGEKAVRWLQPYIVPVEEDGQTRYIVEAPNESRGGLGHNAMAVIAMAEMHDRLSADEVRKLKGLGRSLERMLREKDGGFFENEKEVQERPADKKDELAYEPGEAFLALVMLADVFPEESHWLESARRSGEYQAGIFEGAWWDYKRPQAFAQMLFVDRIHWQTQALDLLGGVVEVRDGGSSSESRRWHRAAVAMGRAILASGAPPNTLAVTESSRPIGPIPPDYIGGFPLPGRIPRTTPTGSRAEALNAARRSAIALGRDPRPFESALVLIAGFQLRNQLDEVSCYWCPAPEKAKGSFRAGLSDNEVRIDYIQHIVAGMADTLDWYGEETPISSSSANLDVRRDHQFAAEP